MSVTITSEDNLVAQLRSQAEARHLSVEALALQILGEAVANGDDEEWRACNQRVCFAKFCTTTAPWRGCPN